MLLTATSINNTQYSRTSINMFYSTLLIAATTLCGLASAQNYSTSGPLTIDPNSVDLDLRQSWCRGQTANCPLICGGQAYPNQCFVVSHHVHFQHFVTPPLPVNANYYRTPSHTNASAPTAANPTSPTTTPRSPPSSAHNGKPTA